jgi:hypothetical protein
MSQFETNLDFITFLVFRLTILLMVGTAFALIYRYGG